MSGLRLVFLAGILTAAAISNTGPAVGIAAAGLIALIGWARLIRNRGDE